MCAVSFSDVAAYFVQYQHRLKFYKHPVESEIGHNRMEIPTVLVGKLLNEP